MSVAELPNAYQPTAGEWLTIDELATALKCSKRKIEYDIAKFRDSRDPFPTTIIYSRRKFKLARVEAWLARHGRLTTEGR